MAYKMLSIGIFILISTIAIAQAQPIVFKTHRILWRFGAWTDYVGGAHAGQFQYGDDLVFIYPRGQHNVIEVDKNGFDNCIAPPSAKALTSGEDWIKLNTTGTRWYICGIGQHCKEHGMKIQIDVTAPVDFKYFTVGYDLDDGWTRNVDYKVWQKDFIFDVGDKLVFNYKKGKHNVIQVDEAAYKQCTIPPKHEALTSGHDEVILKKPGGVGFISGIGDDCKKGMKLFINVVADRPKPPAHTLKAGRKLATENQN